MGKAGKYNIVIEEGSTFGLDLLYKDSSGNRQNLSSYTGRMQIRDSPGGDLIDSTDTNIRIGHKVQNGTFVTSGLGDATTTHQSNISIEIFAAHTANYDFEKAFYDIEIQAGNHVERVIEGSVTLSREITQ